MNATADSFYSSQGRVTNHFVDNNERLIDEIKAIYPELCTLEMESFHLLDLADNSKGNLHAGSACIIIADRYSDSFIDMKLKQEKEKQLGQAGLETLIGFPLEDSQMLNDDRCVWHKEYKK